MIKSKKRGELIVISGPSGAGKGSVIKKLLENNSKYWLSISTTSRQMRENDIDGVTYNFVSKEEFEKKIEENYFLEYNYYVENYYGTPKDKINEKLDEGLDVILEIDINGAMNVKRLIPEAVFIFIMPPSFKELKKRLISRGTETKKQLLERFKTAYNEINEVTKYNYVVVNDNLEDAVKKVSSIISAVKCRVDRIEELDLYTLEEEIHEELVDM